MSFIVNDPMPKTCTECDYRCGLNIIARQNQEGRHEHCPLIELPPHGQLIDADALQRRIVELVKNGYVFDEVGCSGLIESAPTILEASKEESK